MMEQPEDTIYYYLEGFNLDMLPPMLPSVDNTLVSEPVNLDTLQVPVLPLPQAVKSEPPPPPPASIKPCKMSPAAFKEHKNLINRRYQKKKRLEREDDKERIRTLEESLEKQKSRALELLIAKLQDLYMGYFQFHLCQLLLHLSFHLKRQQGAPLSVFSDHLHQSPLPLWP